MRRRKKSECTFQVQKFIFFLIKIFNKLIEHIIEEMIRSDPKERIS